MQYNTSSSKSRTKRIIVTLNLCCYVEVRFPLCHQSFPKSKTAGIVLEWKWLLLLFPENLLAPFRFSSRTIGRNFFCR
jgi:hypothetical protein